MEVAVAARSTSTAARPRRTERVGQRGEIQVFQARRPHHLEASSDQAPRDPASANRAAPPARGLITNRYGHAPLPREPELGRESISGRRLTRTRIRSVRTPGDALSEDVAGHGEAPAAQVDPLARSNRKLSVIVVLESRTPVTAPRRCATPVGRRDPGPPGRCHRRWGRAAGGDYSASGSDPLPQHRSLLFRVGPASE